MEVSKGGDSMEDVGHKWGAGGGLNGGGVLVTTEGDVTRLRWRCPTGQGHVTDAKTCTIKPPGTVEIAARASCLCVPAAALARGLWRGPWRGLWRGVWRGEGCGGQGVGLAGGLEARRLRFEPSGGGGGFR